MRFNILFTNNRHEKLTRAGINHILNKYVALASDKVTTLKQKRITPHVLRHSKAMHLLQNGVNIVYIRDFLGHTSIQTTEIYARASSKLKQKAIENAFVDIYPQEEAEWDNTSTLEWLKISFKRLCKVDNKKNLLYKAIKRSTLHNYLLHIR